MIVKQNIPSYINEYDNFQFNIQYEPEIIVNDTSSESETITEIIEQIQVEPSINHEFVNISTNSNNQNTTISGAYKGVFQLNENSLKTVKRSDKSISTYNQFEQLPKNNEQDCFYFKPPSSLDKQIQFTVDVKFRKQSTINPKNNQDSQDSSNSSSNNSDQNNNSSQQNRDSKEFVLVDNTYMVDKHFAHLPSIEKIEQLNYDYQCAHSLIENCVDNFSDRKTNFQKSVRAVRNSEGQNYKLREFHDKLIHIQQSMLDFDFEYNKLVTLEEVGITEVTNLNWDQIINLEFSEENSNIVHSVWVKVINFSQQVLEKDGRENGYSLRERKINNGYNKYINKCRNELNFAYKIYLTPQEQIFGEYDLFNDYPEDPKRIQHRPYGYAKLMSPIDKFVSISDRDPNIIRYANTQQYTSLMYDWTRRNLRAEYHKDYNSSDLVQLLISNGIYDKMVKEFSPTEVDSLLVSIRDGTLMGNGSNPLYQFIDQQFQNKCPPAQQKVINAIDRKHRAQLPYIENFPKDKKISIGTNRFAMIKDIQRNTNNSSIEINQNIRNTQSNNYQNIPGVETFENGFYHYKKQFTTVIKGSWDIWAKGFRDYLSRYKS